LFDELDHYLDRQLARRSAGPRAHRQRGAIWHACEPRAIDCEAYAVIPARLAADARIAVRQLPAQRVAALIYRGDSDYLPAYRAMRTWIRGSGLEIAGAKRELYLRSPESMTEIQFPIGRPDHAPRHAGHRARLP
jgi:effector-binding domain-containing protein